jgi:hypothetical protein
MRKQSTIHYPTSAVQYTRVSGGQSWGNPEYALAINGNAGTAISNVTPITQGYYPFGPGYKWITTAAYTAPTQEALMFPNGLRFSGFVIDDVGITSSHIVTNLFVTITYQDTNVLWGYTSLQDNKASGSNWLVTVTKPNGTKLAVKRFDGVATNTTKTVTVRIPCVKDQSWGTNTFGADISPNAAIKGQNSKAKGDGTNTKEYYESTADIQPLTIGEINSSFLVDLWYSKSGYGNSNIIRIISVGVSAEYIETSNRSATLWPLNVAPNIPKSMYLPEFHSVSWTNVDKAGVADCLPSENSTNIYLETGSTTQEVDYWYLIGPTPVAAITPYGGSDPWTVGDPNETYYTSGEEAFAANSGHITKPGTWVVDNRMAEGYRVGTPEAGDWYIWKMAAVYKTVEVVEKTLNAAHDTYIDVYARNSWSGNVSDPLGGYDSDELIVKLPSLADIDDTTSAISDMIIDVRVNGSTYSGGSMAPPTVKWTYFLQNGYSLDRNGNTTYGTPIWSHAIQLWDPGIRQSTSTPGQNWLSWTGGYNNTDEDYYGSEDNWYTKHFPVVRNFPNIRNNSTFGVEVTNASYYPGIVYDPLWMEKAFKTGSMFLSIVLTVNAGTCIYYNISPKPVYWLRVDSLGLRIKYNAPVPVGPSGPVDYALLYRNTP